MKVGGERCADIGASTPIGEFDAKQQAIAWVPMAMDATQHAALSVVGSASGSHFYREVDAIAEHTRTGDEDDHLRTIG